MRRYGCSITTQFYEEYELRLDEDGTFKLLNDYSDGAGGWAGPRYEGTWKRSGDRLELVSEKRAWTGTFDGDAIEIEGIGQFTRLSD